MTQKEIRMRCIEAITRMGIQAPDRVIKNATTLEAWVSAAQEKPIAPAKQSPKKTSG